MSITRRTTRGFTIVELLIVVVVIVTLATISLVVFSGTQARTRNAVRMNDLKELQKYVELYRAENGEYPGSANNGNWAGLCSWYGSSTAYVTGISNYMPKQPIDPRYDSPTDNKCYLYISNGTDYSILAYLSVEGICGGDPGNSCNPREIRNLDRKCCVENSFSVSSPGAENW